MHQVISIQNSDLIVKSEVAHESTAGPLSCGSGAHGEHYFRQSPMDERAFVEVQASSREVIAH